MRASLELLAATLGIAGAFTPFYSAPNCYNVEIEALEGLIRQILAAAEAEPERLDVLPDWRDTLTTAVALVVNSKRPLPETLAGPWDELVADAVALAPNLRAEPPPLG